MTGSGGPEAWVIVFDERFDASSLHALRRRTAACAAGTGMPQLRAADVLMAVHELAANAVTHGPGTVRVVMRAAPGALQCQVSNPGPATDHWPVRQGHGLWLVKAVADEVRVSSGPDGSEVTAVFGWR
jgi:anti-sigma regulatory factor (Ser/Thr protein kinase)